MSGMHPGRDWKCDRNGGVKARYLDRPAWTCPHCGLDQGEAGHRCDQCRRRVCCDCFDHESGCCISSKGALSGPNPLRPPLGPCPGPKPKKANCKDCETAGFDHDKLVRAENTWRGHLMTHPLVGDVQMHLFVVPPPPPPRRGEHTTKFFLCIVPPPRCDDPETLNKELCSYVENAAEMWVGRKILLVAEYGMALVASVASWLYREEQLGRIRWWEYGDPIAVCTCKSAA